MWEAQRFPGQGGSPKAPIVQTDDRNTGIREQLRKKREAQQQEKHPIDPMSPSKSSQALNTAMPTLRTPTPAQTASFPHLLSQSHPREPSNATGDEISDFISGISAETSGTVSQGECTLNNQTSKEHRVSSSYTTDLQGRAPDSSCKQLGNSATETPQPNSFSLSPTRHHANVTKQESMLPNNPTTPSSKTAKKHSLSSPDDGEVTNSPADHRKGTNEREQPLITHAMDVPRINSAPNVIRPIRYSVYECGSANYSRPSPEPLELRDISNTLDKGRVQGQQERRSRTSLAQIDKNIDSLQPSEAPSQANTAVSNEENRSDESALPTNLSTSPRIHGTPSTSQDISVVETQCTSQDTDLHDWLKFTGFYNPQYRARYLARQRKMAALEQLRVELLEEDENDRPGMVLSSYNPAATPISKSSLSSTRTQIAVKTNIGSNVPAPLAAIETPPLSAEVRAPPGVGATKRSCGDKARIDFRTVKFPRTQYSDSVEQHRSGTNQDHIKWGEEMFDGTSYSPPTPQLHSQRQVSSDDRSLGCSRTESPPLRRPVSSKSSNFKHSLAHPYTPSSETLQSGKSPKLNLGKPGGEFSLL